VFGIKERPRFRFGSENFEAKKGMISLVSHRSETEKI
jgi:hypothetical protein